MKNDHFANSTLSINENHIDISQDLLIQSNKTIAELLYDKKETEETTPVTSG